MAKEPPYRLKNMMPGMIMLWYGTHATIPSGWGACDGTMGTPDLQVRYVRGAKVAGPGSGHGLTGGSVNHTHDFTGDGHAHDLLGGDNIDAGIIPREYHHTTSSSPSTGTTDMHSTEPPYMTLFYIMKLN